MRKSLMRLANFCVRACATPSTYLGIRLSPLLGSVLNFIQTHKAWLYVGFVVLALGGVFYITLGGSDKVAAIDSLCVSARCKEAAAAEAAATEAAKAAAEQKGTYQGEVNKLAAEVALVQAAIDRNTEEIAQLEIQIEAAMQKLSSLNTILAKTITKLFLAGEASPLELLASAQSFGDWTNQQVQQDTVKRKVKLVADDVKATKASLEKDKLAAERKRADNERARDEVSKKQAEQMTLVLEWQGKETEFAAASEAAKKVREEEMEKQRQQLAAQSIGKIVAGDPNKGGYPFADQCPGNAWAFDNGWGLLCECVSYAGWKVYQNTGYSPQWWGNGNMWANSARNAGFSVGTEPRANSIGVWLRGAYGHVAYIEKVYGDRIDFSDYNWVKWDYAYHINEHYSMFDYYIYL